MNNKSDDERLTRAGDWLLRLGSSELEQYELANWVEWYSEDPENRNAFDSMQRQYEAFRALPPSVRHELASRLTARIDPSLTAKPRSPILDAFLWPRRQPAFALGILAVLVLGASIGIGSWYSGKSQMAVHTAAYQTERAKHEEVTLPDGSVVRLGGLSSLSLSYTEEMRYLVLQDGEAFFDVAHDPKRPFVVQTGAITVRAVGTAFNVRRAADQVAVTVSHGAVDVVRKQGNPEGNAGGPKSAGSAQGEHAVRVSAGEQAWVNAAQAAVTIMPVDPELATAWQSGRFEFMGEPLRAVVATVNRYSPDEIVIADGALAELSYTGTVVGTRVEEWLTALGEGFPVRVERVGTGTVLLSLDSGGNPRQRM